jgi:hypothetical protein
MTLLDFPSELISMINILAEKSKKHVVQRYPREKHLNGLLPPRGEKMSLVCGAIHYKYPTTCYPNDITRSYEKA